MLTEAEFEAPYRRTAPEVHGYLRRRVGDAAPGLLAEVYVIAWTRRRDIPAEPLQRAWLFGTARRLLLSDHRAVVRRVEAERAAARVPQALEDGTAEQRAAIVRLAMSALADVDRELIQLTEWERLSVAEAAVAVGLRPGTARVRLHRARRRLAANPAMQSLITQPVAQASDHP